MKLRRFFTRGTLGFRVLITIFSIFASGFIAFLTQTNLLLLPGITIAGFIIGLYSKGEVLHRGKAAFFGVLVGVFPMFILTTLLILIVMPLPVSFASPYFSIAVFILLLSPLICGILGFIGGLIGGVVTKLIHGRGILERSPSPPADSSAKP